MSHCRGFSTPAFYEFLHQKAREEGRRDRQRGVELAQLALESLQASAETLGSWYHELLPKAWAWFANAKRLDLDFMGAEAAFEEAFRALGDCDRSNDILKAKIWDLQGWLRLFQRRHKEALKLFSGSLEVFESVSDDRAVVRTLMNRAAALDYDSRSEMSVSDLERAGKLVDEKSDVNLTCAIYWDLTVVAARTGRIDKALAAMTACEGFLKLADDPRLPHLFQWARGFIEDCLKRYPTAKANYQDALEGFEALDQPLYSALVMLDLAIVSLHLRQVDDAMRYSSAIVPFFSTLNLGNETLVTFLVIKDGTRRNVVTEKILIEFRNALWRDPSFDTRTGPGQSFHSGPAYN